MLDGQHLFSACKEIVLQRQQQHQAVPQWATKFECRRIKADTSLSDRQLIAGREQARSAQVLAVPLSGKVQWLQKELVAQLAVDKGVTNKSEALRLVYLKCGCTETVEGSVVCI